MNTCTVQSQPPTHNSTSTTCDENSFSSLISHLQQAPSLTPEQYAMAQQKIYEVSTFIETDLKTCLPTITNFHYPLRLLSAILYDHQIRNNLNLIHALEYGCNTSNKNIIDLCFQHLSQNNQEPSQKSNALSKHLNSLLNHELNYVVYWLKAACVINDADCQEICWKFIRKNSLYGHLTLVNNCELNIYKEDALANSSHHLSLPNLNSIKQNSLCIPCCREILSSFSQKLHDLLHKTNEEKIYVFHKDQNIYNTFINYLYTKVIILTENNISDILTLSHKYDIQALKDLCERWYMEHPRIFKFIGQCEKLIQFSTKCETKKLTEALLIKIIDSLSENERSHTPRKRQSLEINIEEALKNQGENIKIFDTDYLLGKGIIDTSSYIDEFTINSLARYCPNLEVIKIHNSNNITLETLNTIVSKFKKLNTLHLLFLNKIPLKNIADTIIECGNITSLDLSLDIKDRYKAKNNDTAVSTITSKLPNLQAISLAQWNITDTSIITLSQNLKLTDINIGGCSKITNLSLKTITSTQSSLRTLIINDLKEITDDGLNEIAPHLIKLTSLDISNCPYLRDRSISEVAMHAKNLTHLNVSGCNITNLTAFALCINAKNLEKLHMTGCCNINELSAIALTNYLPKMTTLDLTNCQKIPIETIKSIQMNLCCKKSPDVIYPN